MEKELKSLKENLIIVIPIIALLIITFIIVLVSLNTCKPAILYINSKAVCQTHGINKNKCKIKVNYCDENKYFHIIKFTKDGKEIEEYINKNAVELITFLDKK